MAGIKRRKTRVVRIGDVAIGGNNPIAIQSMAKCKTSDVSALVRQAGGLKECGCQILRLAIKDEDDVRALKKIKRLISMPIVADIHFNWKFAMGAIEAGVDKIRLNPGNINDSRQVRDIALALKRAGIPVRVGLNSGSLPRSKARGTPAERMVGSAMDYIRMLEGFGVRDIVVSLKASNIVDTIEAYRKMSEVSAYPLHLGVTATGAPAKGRIKSAIAIGALLLDGIGDTIRVSLTDEPREEVLAAREILEAVGLNKYGPRIISCPTCGRCEVDLANLVKGLEKGLSAMDTSSKRRHPDVAVMGCVVNGPGEARDADIGIAFGKKEGLLFRNGKPLKKVPFNKCLTELRRQIERF